jgi:thiazole tautomerase (transcriptional regulator TenI)
VAPSLRLGASVHSRAEADAAADADWWLAGHIFETPSHPGQPGRGLGFISELSTRGVPVIAIGGVTPATVRPLRDAGAHGVAAIRGIWDAKDPSKAALEYL